MLSLPDQLHRSTNAFSLWKRLFNLLRAPMQKMARSRKRTATYGTMVTECLQSILEIKKKLNRIGNRFPVPDELVSVISKGIGQPEE